MFKGKIGQWRLYNGAKNVTAFCKENGTKIYEINGENG
jgi:hypothetical protein